MLRQELLEALKNYHSAFPEEMEYAARFCSLLQNFPLCFSRSLVSGHITGSAWVVSPDGRRVVMLYHRKLNRWLQPGGHADGEENIMRVADKELREETGLSDHVWQSERIFDIDIHLIPERPGEPAHFHYDVRFMGYADPSLPLRHNNESRDVRWMEVSEITEQTGFERSILRMVEKTQQMIGPKSGGMI